MATAVQGVERQLILKTLYMEEIPIVCMYNREEYTLKIEKLTKTAIFFKPDRTIVGLTEEKKIDLTTNYKGVVVVFVVDITSIQENRFVATIPDFLYKNLDRSSPRVNFPSDMQLKFSFLDDRYLLPFAGVQEDAPLKKEDFLPDTDPKDFNALVAALVSWIKGYADEYKLVFFKETKPLNLEEQLVTTTGKTLFLPTIPAKFSESDPYPKKRLITQGMFRHYLESIGIMPAYFDAAEDQFIASKLTNQVLSEAWIPLSFQGYVPGYIHIWITNKEKPPLDYTVIETLYQYANSLVLSLKERGYFESFCLKDKLIKAQGVDISAGGLRFVYPQSYVSATLLLDTELLMKLITPKRTINVKVKILRRYEEKVSVFLGCHFLDLIPEDVRFLYEYIYGKPFTDLENSFF
jgi:rRNA maturation protein Nop10